MDALGRRLLLAGVGCAVALAAAVLADGPLSEPLLKSLAYGLLVAAVLLSAVPRSRSARSAPAAGG